MGRTVEVVVVDKYEVPTIVNSFEFDDLLWRQLEAFVVEVDRLKGTRLLREGASCKVTIKWEVDSGLAANVTVPANDDIAALLHHLRPLVLQSERTHFPKICKLLKRSIGLDAFGVLIDSYRDLFLGKEFYQQISIRSNDTPINSEDTLMAWLNGFEYHRDERKQAVFEDLHKFFPEEVTRGLFVSMLFDKVEAIRRVAEIVNRMNANGRLVIREAASQA